MKFLYFGALAAAALVKRQAASVTEVTITLSSSAVVGVVLTVGPSTIQYSTASFISSASSSSTSSASSAHATSVPASSIPARSSHETVLPPVTTVLPPVTTVLPPVTTVLPPLTTVLPPLTTEVIDDDVVSTIPAVVPLAKRQVGGITFTVTLGSDICTSASPLTFTFTAALSVFSFYNPFCQVLSVSVTVGGSIAPDSGCTTVDFVGVDIPGCSGASTTTTTSVPTTLTTATTATETATTTSVVTSITTTTTTVIGNPFCGCFDQIFTYWFYTSYLCTQSQLYQPFLFCGLVQVCSYVGYNFFPTTYVLTGNQVTTISLYNGYTVPYVPLITTTISNNVVTVPASTLQTYATLPAKTVAAPPQAPPVTAIAAPPASPPRATAAVQTLVNTPVVPYTAGANKAGLGAMAAIAAIAAGLL